MKVNNLTWDNKNWLCQLAMIQLECIREMVRTRKDSDMPLRKAENRNLQLERQTRGGLPMTITMPSSDVLLRQSARMAERAAREWERSEQIGPMTMTLKLDHMASGYMRVVEQTNNPQGR